MQKPLLNSYQRKILKLLVEYKYLTTAQLHTKLQAPYCAITTWRWLDKLREMELVRSFACQPNRGNSSEVGWLLTKRGASEVGFLKYNSHYQRTPNAELLFWREMEINLEQEVMSLPGWRLLRPRTFSPSASLEDKTEQYHILTKAVTWNEYLRTGKLPHNPLSFHSLNVPLKANQHLAYYTSSSNPYLCLAVVFIICPLRGSTVFWKTRIKQYRALAKQLSVIALFPDEDRELLVSHEQFLFKHHFHCTTLASAQKLLNKEQEHKNTIR
jgi:hypothetical protein